MKLEKIIDINKLTKDISPRERLVANLQVRGNRFFYLFKQVLKPYDISEVQFNVLEALRNNQPDPLSAGEISKMLISEASDVTRIIDRMVKKGLVNRTTPENNRRMVLVSLTEAGLKKSEESKDIIHEITAKTEVWTDEEVALLNKLLDKLE
ncbi:MAG TPA: MarR family transcriptional regulator [Microscillaceae bacterium]|nr:MarR family transcriptional regulator [Microscillaceae bacterium]